MTDFHTHILPGIDDGSRSVEESLLMLKALREQGVDTVFATPHFYSAENSPERFLEKRQAAFERLKPHLTPDLPKIRLGAEVEYFDGVSRSAGIRELNLEGTRIILLEMPEGRWSERNISEAMDLNRAGGLTVMLAHIERYIDHQKRGVIDQLIAEGIIIQGSSDFFAEKKTRKKALKLLKQGKIHVLGSDAHNMTSRPPMMGEAMDAVKEYFGRDVFMKLDI